MSDDDMIRRGDVLRVVYDALTYSSGPAAFVQRRIRALPAVQPDAAAIGKAAWNIAVEMELQAAMSTKTAAKAGAIEAAIRALIDNPGKEMVPSEPNGSAKGPSDIGPGDQAVAGAAGPFRANPEDWTEDYAYENGNYMCLCVTCGKQFFGHKRRVTCRVCAKPEPVAGAAQCCMCGKRGLSTADDGGPECELHDGRWVCSSDCYDVALGIMLKPVSGADPVTVQEAARVLLKWEAQQGAVFGACSGVVKVCLFNRVLESLADLAQKGDSHE